jgi:hypothetical protein
MRKMPQVVRVAAQVTVGGGGADGDLAPESHLALLAGGGRDLPLWTLKSLNNH